MNELIQVRTNIFYLKNKAKDKKGNDQFIRHNEIILLIDQPKYTHTNSGQIVRDRGVDELRFCVAKDNLDALIKTLEQLRDVDESELS